MGLSTYRRKRDFRRTPEPEGTPASGEGRLRFVIQKHDATRLHYDFRLESGGVLKSWAVPKGPSMTPGERRLAMQVEDHPFSYKDFEGVIPEGNYGAGPVIVWDEGTYGVPGAESRAETERGVERGIARGRLEIDLRGRKVKGGFRLVRMKVGEGTEWLLIKRADAAAAGASGRWAEASVKTGRTLAEVASGKGRRKGARVTVPGARRAPMPEKARPMLATLVDVPFDRKGWFFEVKWDGFRALARLQGGGAHLISRNGLSLDERFPEIASALEGSPVDMLLDGEVVAVDPEGRPSFQRLQNHMRRREGILIYYVFDILFLGGYDLRPLPLRRRREFLARFLRVSPEVRLGEAVEDAGLAFFEAVRRKGLEGMIAKDGSSPYRSGVRATEWLKVKTHLRQEAVICGYTAPRGSRERFGALILGVNRNGRLVYAGHTGGGFTRASIDEVYRRLEPLRTGRCPLTPKPRTNMPAQWVRPELLCEVKFTEWTSDGRMRHPIFLGLREDKPAEKVVEEKPLPSREVVPGAAVAGPGGAARPGRVLFTNLDKVYWPREKYTKGDVVAYYERTMDLIFPYLRDRPQVLRRHPEGIEGTSFFQKDVAREAPAWARTQRIRSESTGEEVRYLVCSRPETLLYMANLGCIEIHPWHSRAGHLDRPDYCILDLDPVEIPFREVVRTASALKRILDEIGAQGFCKTSGGRGLHVYVPLKARYTTEQATGFAHALSLLAHRRLPDITSLERSPKDRRGKVYLDYLRNTRAQTVVAPYSLRARPGATVSVPLEWEEVRPGLDPRAWTLATVRDRLRERGDVWRRKVLTASTPLAKCLVRLERLFKDASA